MTITLGLWQIVALIALTPLVAVISIRLGILIVSVVSHHWSKVSQKRTNLSMARSRATNWSEKASPTPRFDIAPDGTYLHPNLVGNMGNSDISGATGIVPGGVSWTLGRVDKLSTKNQGRQRISKGLKGSK